MAENLNISTREKHEIMKKQDKNINKQQLFRVSSFLFFREFILNSLQISFASLAHLLLLRFRKREAAWPIGEARLTAWPRRKG